jgi:hypothetical protein
MLNTLLTIGALALGSKTTSADTICYDIQFTGPKIVFGNIALKLDDDEDPPPPPSYFEFTDVVGTHTINWGGTADGTWDAAELLYDKTNGATAWGIYDGNNLIAATHYVTPGLTANQAFQEYLIWLEGAGGVIWTTSPCSVPEAGSTFAMLGLVLSGFFVRRNRAA